MIAHSGAAMSPSFPRLYLPFACLLLSCSATNGDGVDTDRPGGKADDVGVPGLDDEVVMENEFCTYDTKRPFVREVKWEHPKIVAAMRALGPGWRSTFSYSDWRVPYGLENEFSGDDTERRDKKVRNFIRVLCGEYRDYPELLEAKLDVIGQRQVYAGPDEVEEFDLSRDLFEQMTFPAYRRMVATMSTMHRFRQSERRDDNDGFNFNIGEFGGDSNRVENSVPPWTHCEMKFMFSRFMVKDAPRVSQFADEDTETQVTAQTYEDELAAFTETDCTPEDLSLMYNFRGHNNYKALWLESNAFIWNSRRGRKVAISRGDEDYYLHPFAERHSRSRAAWGAYLFHTDDDNESMRLSSESGGGPILYITDQDLDENGIADYRVFPDDFGCGDQGVGVVDPDENCNMVPWDQAFETPSSVGAASSWDPELVDTPDMGFQTAFTSFEERMARFNQALDRHTNWGPTNYYMLDASAEDAEPDKIRMFGAYSPIVACSYDISASDFFARRDFIPNDFEQGQTKWMYVMRFSTDDYYDEKDMTDGKPMDFSRQYFNETSLSNDFFSERALDRFGFVPPDDIHAVVYFVYGDRGEAPPQLEDIPAP